jgi:hypothetical protein
LGANSGSIRDELHEAFAKISSTDLNTGAMDLLKLEVPLLRRLLVSMT